MRLLTPSFAKMLLACDFTVLRLTSSFIAISLFQKPRRMSFRTSISRRVRSVTVSCERVPGEVFRLASEPEEVASWAMKSREARRASVEFSAAGIICLAS